MNEVRRGSRADREGFTLMRKILALVLSMMILVSALVTGVPQVSAATDGMVRVYLKSMNEYGSIMSTKVTLNGSYSVPANPDVVLSTRGEYTVEVVGGSLMLSGTGINGAVDMGSKFTIKQHANDNGSIGTMSLYNNRYGNRSYRGDMQFDIYNGALRLINTVYIEDYLYGVLAGELSNTFPLETLKAQAVIARSYVYNRMLKGEPNYEIGDTSSDQVYKGYNSANNNIIKAVDDTAGVLLKYGSSYVNAYFGASNGGQVELPGNAWSSSSSLGCYVMKDDPYDVRNPSSRSVTYTFTSNPASLDSSFYSLIQQKVYQKTGYYGNISSIMSVSLSNPVETDRASRGISRNYRTMNMTVLVDGSYSGGDVWGGSYGDNGSNVWDGSYGGNGSNVWDENSNVIGAYSMGDYGTSVVTEGVSQSVDITIDLHDELKYALFSADSDLRLFTLETTGDYYYLTLARYGHGVGMSQRGAQQMANEGKSYKDIIKFYFNDISLPTVDFQRAELTKYIPISSTPIALGTVTASSLTVRGDASSSGKKLGSLSKGATVEVYADLGEWLCVVYNGSIGYISSSYVTLESYTGGAATATPTASPDASGSGNVSNAAPAVGTATVKLSSASSTLKMRKDASSSGTVVTKLPHGTTVEVLEQGAEWCKVRTSGGSEGYCATAYLTVSLYGSSGTTATPTPTNGTIVEGTLTPTPTASAGNVPAGSSYILYDSTPLLAAIGGNVYEAMLSKNTVVTILSTEGSYYRVRTADGSTGYVAAGSVATAGTGSAATAAPTATASASGSTNVNSVAATGKVTGTSVNVRSGPATSASKIGAVTKDQTVQIISSNNGFYKIIYGTGTGYVSGDYIRIISSGSTGGTTSTAAPTPTPTASTGSGTVIAYGRVTGSNLNVRASASTSGSKLGSLSRNDTVEILSSTNGFYKIVYKNGIGYVSADYITVISNVATSTAKPTPTPTANSGAAGAGTLMFISVNDAKLATTPGGNMVSVMLSKGSVVTLISTEGDYYYVRASNGSTGYLSKYEASSTPDININPEYLLPAGTKYIKVDDTPIRSSLDSSVYYGSLAIGTAVTIEKTDGAFSYISTSSGTKGWITTESIGTAVGIANQPTATPDAGSNGSSSGSGDSSTGVKAKIKLSSSSSYLNMRQEPSTSADKVKLLYHEDTVYVLSSSGDWYKVNASGQTGYVMKKYVALGDGTVEDSGSSSSGSSSSSSSSYSGTIRLSGAGATVNVRSGAGTNNSKLGTLAHGATVKVIASNGDWYKIEYGTGYGYVLKSYVKLTNGSTGSSSSSSSSGTATTTTSLTLRSTGSTSGDKLGVYAKGTKVTVVSKGGTWSKVKVDGKTGYMKNEYLKFN